MFRAVSETVTPAASSSVMVTVAVAPAVTSSGIVPKPSATLSPSSSMSSAVALKVNDFSVSPFWNTRFPGTPE